MFKFLTDLISHYLPVQSLWLSCSNSLQTSSKSLLTCSKSLLTCSNYLQTPWKPLLTSSNSLLTCSKSLQTSWKPLLTVQSPVQESWPIQSPYWPVQSPWAVQRLFRVCSWLWDSRARNLKISQMYRSFKNNCLNGSPCKL